MRQGGRLGAWLARQGGRRCAWLGRHPELYWLLGALTAAVVAWLTAPGHDAVLYFLSSVLQGSAAVLGIALTGAFIAFQVTVDRYGVVVGSRHLSEVPLVRKCVISFAAVVSLSAIGLAIASHVKDDPSPWEMPLRVCVFLTVSASLITARLLWSLLQTIPKLLSPTHVMRQLAEAIVTKSLQHGAARPETEFSEVSHILSDRLEGAAFGQGWHSYLGAISEVIDSRPREEHWVSCDALCNPIRRFLWRNGFASPADGSDRRAIELRRAVANTLFSLVHSAVERGSPGAFPIGYAVCGIHDDELSESMGLHFCFHSSELLHSGTEPRLAFLAALRIAFWRRLGLYQTLKDSLAEFRRLDWRLPDDVDDEDQFVDALSEALSLSPEETERLRATLDQLVS